MILDRYVRELERGSYDNMFGSVKVVPEGVRHGVANKSPPGT